MNNPPYFLTDVMADIVAAVKAALDLPVLNYQYGYVDELKETLKQYEDDPEKYDEKFPLVWLVQPFTVTHGEEGVFGSVEDLQLFFIQGSDKHYKASERMATTFKPALYSIYRETFNQFTLHPALNNPDVTKILHKHTDRYYWGEEQQKFINDVFD